MAVSKIQERFKSMEQHQTGFFLARHLQEIETPSRFSIVPVTCANAFTAPDVSPVILPEVKLAFPGSCHLELPISSISPPQHRNDLAHHRSSRVMDDDQVQTRLQGLTISERPNRKCKAPTEDNEEVEVRIPAKRHNIDLDLLDDPFDEPQIHTVGKHDILGARLDFVNQENARKNAKPVIEIKKNVSMLVPEIEDSTFSLEAVFAAAKKRHLDTGVQGGAPQSTLEEVSSSILPN